MSSNGRPILGAALGEDLAGRRDPFRRAVGVPQVGVPRGRPERLGRPRAADQDRQARLDGSWLADGVAHRVEAALVGHRLAVEQPADEPDRLVKPVQPLAEPGAEVDAEGVVLALEPATADPQDHPTVRQVVQGRGELGGQARVPERVGADEQAEPDALGQDGQGRQRRPALELGVARVALVGEQVVVDPERVPAGRLDRAAGRQQVRPGRPVDPERRSESHAGAQAWIVARKRKTGIPAAYASASVSGRAGDRTSSSDRRRPNTTSL